MQYQARSFDKYMQTEERRGKRKMVKTKDAVNDMTVGTPAKLIIQFMIPVFWEYISTVLQYCRFDCSRTIYRSESSGGYRKYRIADAFL